MFFVISILKNSEILRENIGGGDLQVFRKVSLIEIYNKFIFLRNTTKQGNILISAYLT